MRKIQMACIGVFAAGVLLTGVGFGVATAEYSSLQYGGEKLWGGNASATKVLEFSLPASEEPVIILGFQRMDLAKVSQITEDPDLQEGVVRYEITYNDTLVEPYLYFEEYGGMGPVKEPTEYAGVLKIGLDYTENEFKTFMEMKEIILQELKERRISAYRSEYVTDIRILVHPNTRASLKEPDVVY